MTCYCGQDVKNLLLDHVELTGEEKELFDMIRDEGLMPMHEKVVERLNGLLTEKPALDGPTTLCLMALCVNPKIPQEYIRFDAYNLMKIVSNPTMIGEFQAWSSTRGNRFTASPLFISEELAALTGQDNKYLCLLINARDGMMLGFGKKCGTVDPTYVIHAHYILGKSDHIFLETEDKILSSRNSYGGIMVSDGSPNGSFWIREIEAEPINVFDSLTRYVSNLKAMER